MSVLAFILRPFRTVRPANRTAHSSNRGPESPAEPLRLSGNWRYEQDVVGEASYQRELGAIAGPKSPDGVEVKRTAYLICEDANPHDKNAVAVMIDGRKVAYLSRQDAVEYRKSLAKLDPSLPNAACRAKIVGGWERVRRNKVEQGHFGVKLDLVWPLKKIEEKTR
ncbi:MAG: hypothetical protein ACK4NE_05805 [Albidovulum sp.]